MTAAKIYLGLVGAAYIALAAWCALKPTQTSRSVGFELQPGSGQSEYFVVYGGLQLGLGLMFLFPFWQQSSLDFCLLACLIIHAILVTFRTTSFFLYSGIQTTTYILSSIEWLIFLAAAYFYWTKS